MSRSGYIEDIDGPEDQWRLIRWRGAVASAVRGRRGQAFLREMLAALDALPQPRLIPNNLMRGGEVCALGAVAVSRRKDVRRIDPEDRDRVADAFGIPFSLACEIMYENDEASYCNETPKERFSRVRAWVVSQMRTTE